jgi:hypothetical protein
MNKAAYVAGYLAVMTKVAAEPVPSFDKWKTQAPVSAVYDAISAAEHRGRTGDKFIRTQAPETKSGSTAWGPLQLTGTYVKDYMPGGRYPKFLDKNPQYKQYANDFLQQAKMFAQHGKNKGKPGYNPKYDYSATGHLGGTSKQKLMYQRFAQAMMKHRAMNDPKIKGNWDKYRMIRRSKAIGINILKHTEVRLPTLPTTKHTAINSKRYTIGCTRNEYERKKIRKG